MGDSADTYLLTSMTGPYVLLPRKARSHLLLVARLFLTTEPSPGSGLLAHIAIFPQCVCLPSHPYFLKGSYSHRAYNNLETSVILNEMNTSYGIKPVYTV